MSVGIMGVGLWGGLGAVWCPWSAAVGEALRFMA